MNEWDRRETAALVSVYQRTGHITPEEATTLRRRLESGEIRSVLSVLVREEDEDT